MDGWIKLYRKVLANPVCMKDGDHLAIWVYLLLKATHKDYNTLFNGRKIILFPGQLITGRKSISVKLKISESKVQRILTSFENEQQIEQQTGNKNRLVTILNWDEYQQTEQPNEQQVNNNRTTSEQQVNTNKNIKNIKNIKKDKNNIYSIKLFLQNKEEILLKATEKYPDKNCEKAIEDFIGYIQSRKTKYRDFKLAFFNWVREDRFNQYGQQKNFMNERKVNVF